MRIGRPFLFLVVVLLSGVSQAYDPLELRSVMIGEETGNSQEFGSLRVTYFSSDQKEQYRLRFKDGKVLDSSGHPYDTRGGNLIRLDGSHFDWGQAMVVMDQRGGVYANSLKIHGHIQHSSFLGHELPAFAGAITVHSGVLIRVRDHSGHFTPSLHYSLQFVEELHRQNVDLSQVDFQFYESNVRNYVLGPNDLSRVFKFCPEILLKLSGPIPDRVLIEFKSFFERSPERVLGIILKLDPDFKKGSPFSQILSDLLPGALRNQEALRAVGPKIVPLIHSIFLYGETSWQDWVRDTGLPFLKENKNQISSASQAIERILYHLESPHEPEASPEEKPPVSKSSFWKDLCRGWFMPSKRHDR